MCATIMCQFTMESFEIIGKTKRSIVPEATELINDCLLRGSDHVIAKSQPSYCEQDFLPDYSCHACGGGCLCSYQRRFRRFKRDSRELPMRRVVVLC